MPLIAWLLLFFTCVWSQVEAATYLVDFGLPGSQTTVAGGNTWNNVTATNNETVPNTLESTLVLLDTGGVAGITMEYKFPSISPGGVYMNFNSMYGYSQTTSSLSNLGLMNVDSAKNDGIWSQGPVSLVFSGLEADLFYTFSLFAHRVNDPQRSVLYQLLGATDSPVVERNVATTRDNGGELVVFSNYQADANGEIELRLTAGVGNYTYINAMQIVAVPEPGRWLLLVFGGVGVLLRRQR